MNRVLRHAVLYGMMWASVLVVLGGVGTLTGYVVLRGAPALGGALFFGDAPPLAAILGEAPVWEGIWPACAGTICLVGLTMALALFPGIGCGIYLAEFASGAAARRIRTALDILAGTPSIVMGLSGFALILLLRRTILPQANTSLLLAAGCLALLVLPVLVSVTCEALESLPQELRLTALALGFTRRQMAWKVLLPAAGRGIMGGVVLAVGRAAEDTAVIMLTGVVANAGLPAGISETFEALPFTVFYTAAQYQTQDELMRGFGAALVLLALAALLLALARLLDAGARHRWRRGGSV